MRANTFFKISQIFKIYEYALYKKRGGKKHSNFEKYCSEFRPEIPISSHDYILDLEDEIKTVLKKSKLAPISTQSDNKHTS